MPETDNVKDLLAHYRQAAENTSEPMKNPREHNKWADKLHACYKELRKSAEGRAGIVDLIGDPNPHVRAWAAAHSLMWAPDVARPALEAERDAGGLLGFEAEIVLDEFDKGELSFDH